MGKVITTGGKYNIGDTLAIKHVPIRGVCDLVIVKYIIYCGVKSCYKYLTTSGMSVPEDFVLGVV